MNTPHESNFNEVLYCMDNLPIDIRREFFQLFESEGSAAVSRLCSELRNSDSYRDSEILADLHFHSLRLDEGLHPGFE